jgi:PPOX class probable F420-dependent enzyme
MSESGSPMGHGVKQRDRIKMTPEEVDDFLAERNTMALSTIDKDGRIHTVAMWYGFVDGAVCFETKTKSQKVRNLRRNPTMTCMAEKGEYYEELRGVELVGTGEIIDDADQLWQLGVNVFERYYGAYTDELAPFVEAMLNKRVLIRLHVDKVVSWDHRKLGLPSTRPES